MYPHERSLVENMQGRPFVLLGVNNDPKLATVKQAVKENKLNWRSWWDGSGGPIVRSFGVRAFPTILLVDHTGVIRYHTDEHPSIRSPTVLDQAIEGLVKEAEGGGMVGTVATVDPKLRTFKDKTGEYTVFAMFKSYADGQVTLEKDDGTVTTVALDSLSRRDQDYLERSGFLVEAESEVASSTDSDAAKSSKSDFRTFVDSTGDFKVRARVVAVEDGSVTLRKEDGTEIAVPLENFSAGDRQFIRDHFGPDS